MRFPANWTELQCIEHLQRRILVYSLAYYEYDASPISDYDYDNLAHDLVRRMNNCENASDSRYHYAFYDYEGSTGFHLYYRLTDEDKRIIDSIAKIISQPL